MRVLVFAQMLVLLAFLSGQVSVDGLAHVLTDAERVAAAVYASLLTR